MALALVEPPEAATTASTVGTAKKVQVEVCAVPVARYPPDAAALCRLYCLLPAARPVWKIQVASAVLPGALALVVPPEMGDR